MFIKDLTFQVEFSAYAEAHFCKAFYKKYKGKKWLETKSTIINTLQRAFMMQQTTLIDVLKYSQEDDAGIFKFDFKVAGTPFSPKGSGNRAIFYLCNNTGKIDVLLVYGKDECGRNQSETQWVLGHVKRNFSEYKKYC